MVPNVVVSSLNLTPSCGGSIRVKPYNHNNEEATSVDVREVVPGRSSDGLVSMSVSRGMNNRVLHRRRQSLPLEEKGFFYTCYSLSMIPAVSFVLSGPIGCGGVLLVVVHHLGLPAIGVEEIIDNTLRGTVVALGNVQLYFGLL